MRDGCIGSGGIPGSHRPCCTLDFDSYGMLRSGVHCLPVESSFVLDASFVRQLGEVDPLEQRLQFWEEFVEARCIF